MDLLGGVDPVQITTEALAGLAFLVIKIVALGALGLVAIGLFASCLCDVFECRKWRQCQGRTETWQLMH